MHFPYVHTPKAPHRSRWITEDGFRLLATLPAEVNALRFARHVARLAKRDARTLAGRRFRMKLRRLTRGRA